MVTQARDDLDGYGDTECEWRANMSGAKTICEVDARDEMDNRNK